MSAVQKKRRGSEDPRPLDAIRAADLVPFVDGIAAGAEAVMVAHVTYPAIDPLPAGYSEHWIRRILRDSMGFDGIVVSDAEIRDEIGP